MIVIDASVVIEILLQTDDAERLTSRLRVTPLHAPEIIELEILQVLRRYCLHEGLSDERALQAISAYGTLNIATHRHAWLRERVWSLRSNLSAYDAAYVALAEILGAPLLTRDARLARTSGHRAIIELIA